MNALRNGRSATRISAALPHRLRQERSGASDQPGAPRGVRDKLKNFGYDVSLETVRKWSAGESRPTPDKMKALSRLLDVDEAWLSLGIKPDMAVDERKARNAAVDGAVNLVTALLQMAGAHCAFPGDDDPARGYVDLYAIIRGRHRALKVTLCQVVGDAMRFQAPVEYEQVVVLSVVRTGFSRAEVYVIPPDVIANGRSRGGYIEIEAHKSGNDLIAKGGCLVRVRKADHVG